MKWDLVNVIDQLNFLDGDISKTDYEKDGWSLDPSPKTEVLGDPKPGAKVEIHWNHFEYVDSGYIFMLPGYDHASDGLYTFGVIHIPVPKGIEKEHPHPEWATLWSLENNNLVKRIVIGETKRRA